MIGVAISGQYRDGWAKNMADESGMGMFESVSNNR